MIRCGVKCPGNTLVPRTLYLNSKAEKLRAETTLVSHEEERKAELNHTEGSLAAWWRLVCL